MGAEISSTKRSTINGCAQMLLPVGAVFAISVLLDAVSIRNLAVSLINSGLEFRLSTGAVLTAAALVNYVRYWRVDARDFTKLTGAEMITSVLVNNLMFPFLATVLTYLLTFLPASW